MFLDLHAPFDAPLTSATPPVRVSTPELNEAASRAMGEPGIFKGCRGTDGPLPAERPPRQPKVRAPQFHAMGHSDLASK